MAALQPPVGRTMLLAKLDETLHFGASQYQLGCNEFQDGTIHPRGFERLAGFELENGIPTWRYAGPGWRLEKQVWCEQAENTTFVRYLLRQADAACRLELLPLCAGRDFHAEQHARLDFNASWTDALEVRPGPDAPPFWLACEQPAGFAPAPDWWRNFLHREELARGLPAVEDLFTPGTLSVALLPGQPVTFRASTLPEPAPFAGALDRALEHAKRYLSIPLPPQWERLGEGTNGEAAMPPERRRHPHPTSPASGRGALVEAMLPRLRLAASQFLVERWENGRGGRSVIAGYHWFGDWGRDTMISLPGLALGTGQPELARDILRTFAGYVDQGMVPNNFGEGGEGPTYNTVDATLWFFLAIDAYLRASQDGAFLKELFPTLQDIVDWHLRGTRYNIRVDPLDGLLSAGEENVQLTWTDAKVDDWVVTPRHGKPVEVNALWFNAVCLMAAWARELQRDAAAYQELASKVGASFRRRFWNPATNCLFDVIDGPDGDDAAVRPNQVFAVSLPFAAIFGPQAKAVVETIQRELLTPYGLRSLTPADPRYRGRYDGDRWQRDGAYHEGTVWAWLMGPFVDAYMRTANDKERARAMVQPLLAHLQHDAGLGSISEIFDGDSPHQPRGCIAQAWSVAELLRVVERYGL